MECSFGQRKTVECFVNGFAHVGHLNGEKEYEASEKQNTSFLLLLVLPFFL